MDWITLTVEAAGIAILCVWVIVPIREFAAIARRMLPMAKSKLDRPQQSKAAPTPTLVETSP